MTIQIIYKIYKKIKLLFSKFKFIFTLPILKSSDNLDFKKNINEWMNMTKIQRYKLTDKERFKAAEKNKKLLSEIRKEYNNYLKYKKK